MYRFKENDENWQSPHRQFPFMNDAEYCFRFLLYKQILWFIYQNQETYFSQFRNLISMSLRICMESKQWLRKFKLQYKGCVNHGGFDIIYVTSMTANFLFIRNFNFNLLSNISKTDLQTSNRNIVIKLYELYYVRVKQKVYYRRFMI